jgi:hypothetical protein
MSWASYQWTSAADVAVGEPYRGDPLSRSPATRAINTPESRQFTNGVTNGECFNIRDIAGNLEIHVGGCASQKAWAKQNLFRKIALSQGSRWGTAELSKP